MRKAKLFMAIIGVSLLAGCSRPAEAKHVLREMGMRQIQTSGYVFFSGCGKDTIFTTGFSAISPNGIKVRGVVCGNLFSSHVRFY